MEAKVGSLGFDFECNYNVITLQEFISFTLPDGRRVTIKFSEQQNGTKISESFEAEDNYSIELRGEGWQAIWNNFQKYAESII